MSNAAPVPVTAEPDASAPETPVAEAVREKKGRKGVVLLGVGLIVALATLGIYRLVTADEQSTDNALVDADVVAVSVRTAGQVAAVQVAENSPVHKGDVVLVIDDAELSARERQAQAAEAAAEAQAGVADAQVGVAEASARGGLSTAEAQVTTTRAQLGSADAQIDAAKAELTRRTSEAMRAATDLTRLRSLFAAGAATQQALDAAVSADAGATAGLQGATAQLLAAQDASVAARSRMAEAGGAVDANTPVDAKIAVARANSALAHANLDAARAALDLAKIAHGYATVLAPADGIVSRVSVHPGQLVVAGQQVATVVPQVTYVVANFKETQIADMRAGAPVDVVVDGFPGRAFHGVVDSVAPGTGSRFSMLAPDNASGNFVKVVQRVPVRIAWADLPADIQLRPGQSVEVTVHTGQ